MELIRVNGEAVNVQDAVRRDMLHENSFLTNTIEVMVLEQYAQDNGITNTDQEMQVALDEMRYQRGLESIEAMNQWLRQNNQSLDSAVSGLEGVTFHDLYEEYPDFDVDVPREQQLLAAHDTVVLQHRSTGTARLRW